MKKFLFWEKCFVCKKWKVIKKERWEYEIHDTWNFVCNSCAEKDIKLKTKEDEK